MRPPQRFEFNFNLRSWVFGLGFGKDSHWGFEAFIGLGPVTFNYIHKP